MRKAIRVTLYLFFPILLLLLWSSCANASEINCTPVSHLLISEVYPNADSSEPEWVELFNPTDADIILLGFTIEDLTMKPQEIKYEIIPANQFLVLEKGVDFNFTLNNDKETVSLKENGILVDQVSWGELNQLSPPEKGQSLIRYPEYCNSFNNLSGFIIGFPNKGIFYQKPTYPNKIKITEILPAPGENSEEFIEIYNYSDESINLNEWYLDDMEGGSSPFKIKDKIILPNEYLVFSRAETKIYLNDDGDEVRLLNPEKDLVSLIKYDKAQKEKSYNLNIDEVWYWAAPTPGGSNAEREMENNDGFGGIVQPVNISEAKSKESGEKLTIQGIVNVSPFILSSQYFYIQDGSSGIQIYCYKSDFDNYEVGDLIEVSGELSQVSGEKRLKITTRSDIKLIEKKKETPIPKEKEINEIKEVDIGTLVSVEGRVKETSGSTFIISDASEDIKVVIKEGTKIKKPSMHKGDRVRVCGVLSIYKGEYRILPINPQDVKIVSYGNRLPEAGGKLTTFLVLYSLSVSIWIIYSKLKKKRRDWQNKLYLFLVLEILLHSKAILVPAKLHLQKR